MSPQSSITRKVYLTFPKDKVPEALLWRASQIAQTEAVGRVVSILKSGADERCEQALEVLENLVDAQVVTNVRGASVSDELGIMAVEVSGQEAHVERALAFLADNGVKVEPIEKNVIE